MPIFLSILRALRVLRDKIRTTRGQSFLLQKKTIAGKIESITTTKMINLKKIQQPVEPLLKETGAILKERVKSDIPIINTISDIAPVTKGKKIRSTLLFLLAGMNGSLISSSSLAEIAASTFPA